MTKRLLICLLMLLGVTRFLPAADDLLIADFEGKDYGDWKTTGTAFGAGPALGTFPEQTQPSGYMGKRYINTGAAVGTNAIGTLTSPEFKIQRDYICFLLGGNSNDGVAINLLVNGKTVHTASSRDGTHMEWSSWDVKELKGKSARIEIVDRTWTGAYLLVDQITQSDDDKAKTVPRFQRSVLLEKQYLNFPVKTKAPKRRFTVLVGDEKVRIFDIELADGPPDFWASIDVSPWKGKTAKFHLDQVPENKAGLLAIDQTDQIKNADSVYHETLRPQFHFTQKRGWNNDPNGMVYFDGEWHLFFQYNPYGLTWGNMHWGHAVSKDLLHWTELPIALYPWTMAKGMCWSGSTVVDHENTAGFQTGKDPAMVAIFTDTGCGESIASSNDHGRTWSYWKGNPVVAHNGRDPKVFWYAPGKHWVMAAYNAGGSDAIAIYNSTDLKKWKLQSRLAKPGFLECPELFELPVDGDKAHTKWVAFAGNAQYVIGQFDGKTFTPDSLKKLDLHAGNYYASQTFTDAPDGRRIQIGWATIAFPGMPFNQMMSFPCELSLRSTPDGVRMFAQPIKEIEQLRRKCYKQSSIVLQPNKPLTMPVDGRALEIFAEFQVGQAKSLGLRVFGQAVGYNVIAQVLHPLPLKPMDGIIRLHILVDRTSLEIYGNDGQVSITTPLHADERNKTVEAFSDGRDTKLNQLEIYELKSIWE